MMCDADYSNDIVLPSLHTAAECSAKCAAAATSAVYCCSHTLFTGDQGACMLLNGASGLVPASNSSVQSYSSQLCVEALKLAPAGQFTHSLRSADGTVSPAHSTQLSLPTAPCEPL